MKHATTLILAAACLTLACALVWTREKPAKEPTAGNSVAAFVPALANPDLDLLDRRIGDLRLDGVTLDEAARTLSDRTKVPVSVDWTALANVEVEQKLQLHLSLTNATLEDALNAIVSILPNKEKPRAEYYVADGMVTITSWEEVGKHCVTVYLNILPLIEEMLAYADLDWAAAEKNSKASAIDTEPARDVVIEEITRLITDLVAADSWRDSGGTIGSIRAIAGVLVIEQTPRNVRGIRTLLERLHQSMHSAGLAWMTDATPATGPTLTRAGANSATTIFTECLNVRSLLSELQARHDAHDQMQAQNSDFHARFISDFENAIINTIAPDSWRESGGNLGSIHTLGGVMVVTQSAENLAAVHEFLHQLHHAITTNDRLPATHPAATEPATQPARTVAYFNIRSLEVELGAGKPTPTPLGNDAQLSTVEAVERIESFVTTTVAPDSWQDAGGTDGVLQEIGGVLVVTQKPENIEAVRMALQNLQAAILRNDFPPPVHGNGTK